LFGQLGAEKVADRLWWRLTRRVNVTLLIAPDFRVRITGGDWAVSGAETEHASIFGLDFVGDFTDAYLEYNAFTPEVSIAAIRLQNVLRFAILAAI